jgi:hypothetical protein
MASAEDTSNPDLAMMLLDRASEPSERAIMTAQLQRAKRAVWLESGSLFDIEPRTYEVVLTAGATKQ